MAHRGLSWFGDTPRRGARGAEAVGFRKDFATRRICDRIDLPVRYDRLGAVPRRNDGGCMESVGRHERPK